MKTKKLFLVLSLLVASSAFGSPITVDVISAPQGLTITNNQATFTLPSSKLTEQIVTQSAAQNMSNKTFTDSASNVSKQIFALYDFSTLGGAVNSDLDLGISIPAKSVIVSAYADVITAPLGGSSSALGFSVGDGGTSAANNSGNLSNIIYVGNYATGSYQMQMRGASSSQTNLYPMVKLTGASKVYANIRGAALTAGKVAVYVHYLISQ